MERKLVKRFVCLVVAMAFLLPVALFATDNPTKINVNTATQEELCTLKGVGPAIAEKIIEARDAKGGFKSLDDLMEVKGIGPKIIEFNKEIITFE